MYPNNNQGVRPKGTNIQGPSIQGPRQTFKIPIRPKIEPTKPALLPTPDITLTSGYNPTNKQSQYPNNNQGVRPKGPNTQGPSFQGPRKTFNIPIRPKTVPNKQETLPTPDITLTSGDHLINKQSQKVIQDQQQSADATLIKADLNDLPHIRRQDLDKIQFNLLELYYFIYKNIIETLDTSSVDKVKLQAKKEDLQCIRAAYKTRLSQPSLCTEDSKNSVIEDIPFQFCGTVAFQKLKNYSTKLNRMQAVNKRTLQSTHFNKLCREVQVIYVKRLRQINPNSQKKNPSIENKNPSLKKKNQNVQKQSDVESTSLLSVAAQVIRRLVHAKNEVRTQTTTRRKKIKTHVEAGAITTFKEAIKSVESLKTAQVNSQQVKTAKVQEVLKTQSETAVDSLKRAPVDCQQETTSKSQITPVDCQQEKTREVQGVFGTQSKIAKAISDVIKANKEAEILAREIDSVTEDSSDIDPILQSEFYTVELVKLKKFIRQSDNAFLKKQIPLQYRPRIVRKAEKAYENRLSIKKNARICNLFEAAIKQGSEQVSTEDQTYLKEINIYFSNEFAVWQLTDLKDLICEISKGEFSDSEVIAAVQETKRSYWRSIAKSNRRSRFKIFKETFSTASNYLRQLKTTKSQEEVSGTKKSDEVTDTFNTATDYPGQLKTTKSQEEASGTKKSDEVTDTFYTATDYPGDLKTTKSQKEASGTKKSDEVIETFNTANDYPRQLKTTKSQEQVSATKKSDEIIETFNTANDYSRQLKITKSQEEVIGPKKSNEVTDTFNTATDYLRQLKTINPHEQVSGTKKSDVVIESFNTAIVNLQQLKSTVDCFGINRSEPVIESLKSAIINLRQPKTTEFQRTNRIKKQKAKSNKTKKKSQVNKQNTSTSSNMANPRPLIDVANQQIFDVPQQQPGLYVPNQQPRATQQQPFLSPTLPNVQGNRPSVDPPKRSLTEVLVQQTSGQEPKPNVMNQQPAMNTNKALKRSLYGPKGIPRSFYAQKNDTAMFPQTCGQVDVSPPVPNTPMLVQTDQQTSEMPQTYSPTDMYDADPQGQEENRENSHSPSQETEGEGGERVSAFRRLGPAAKKPRLTINLLFSKENGVREVIDLDLLPEPYVPVWERTDVLSSTDDTVVRFLPYWPWKRAIGLKKTVVPRSSKSVMIMELEQMVEAYDSNNQFIKISVKNYPPTFKKEDVLDTLIETVKGKNFIPIFIEFTPEGCCFLVLRSRSALSVLHQNGLVIQKAVVKMPLAISITDLSLSHIDFIPRIILRKRLMIAHDDTEAKLDLKEFCLGSDISNFIYFPLHFISNQTLLTQLAMSCISWDQLRSLNLSGNKLRTLEGFDLATTAPKLKHLDLSNNYLEKMTTLLPCRGLLLTSLKLEGNPLCLDYIDPVHYIKVAKMIFPTLCEIDSVEIPRKDSLPSNRGNYCPFDYAANAWSCIQILTPLWSSMSRQHMLPLYHAQSMLSVTYDPALRYTPTYRIFRSLFSLPRDASEREIGRVTGGSNIVKQLVKWPSFHVDPYNTLVDVMFSNEHSLILRICGVFKMTVDTLAENEPLLHYTRTLVISAGLKEWHIDNEMIYWAQPTTQCANNAFSITTVEPPLQLSLKLESPPDEELKDNLISIFMNITKLNKKRSERCLDLKDWDIKAALEHFMKLLKLNTMHSLDTQEG